MKTGKFKKLRLILLLFIVFGLAVTVGLAACASEASNPGAHVVEMGSQDVSPELAVPVQPQVPVFVRPDQMPSLHINIAAHDIHRHNWTRGLRASLRGAGEEFDFENVRVRVRGRGNSTWGAMGEKRPFRIRFESPRSMFGTEYIARDWVLLANSIDYSHMRTVVPFYLGMRMGRFDFNPLPAQFVHVYLDGDYRGVYQFTDQMQQGLGRIEVNFHPDPALSEAYLHWCRHWRHPDDIFFHVGGIPFEVRYPNADDMTDEHLEFLHNYIYEIDRVIRGGNFDEVAALIDIPTFVDFYLVNEFTKNADVFFSSVNFSVRLEDTGRHRLFIGPLWDFDQSAGGTFDSFYPDYSPQGAWAATENEWFRRLMRIPEFRAAASERWFEIRDVEVVETLEKVRYLTTRYRDDFERNFERWPNKLGQHLWRTPPTMRVIDTYEGQVEYLLDWFAQRIVWLDEFLG